MIYGLLTLSDPNKDQGRLDERQEDQVQLVVTGVHPPEFLDPAEEPLHDVPALVQLPVVGPRVSAALPGRDHGRVAEGLAEPPRPVALVGAVHQDRDAREARTDPPYRDPPLGGVVDVARGKVQLDDFLVICGYHVKLGVPSSPGFPDGLPPSFFWAPWASGWTLQEVLSIASTFTSTRSIRSRCRAPKARRMTPFSHHLLNRW